MEKEVRKIIRKQNKTSQEEGDPEEVENLNIKFCKKIKI